MTDESRELCLIIMELILCKSCWISDATYSILKGSFAQRHAHHPVYHHAHRETPNAIAKQISPSLLQRSRVDVAVARQVVGDEGLATFDFIVHQCPEYRLVNNVI